MVQEAAASGKKGAASAKRGAALADTSKVESNARWFNLIGLF